MQEGLDLYGLIVVQNRLYFNSDNMDAQTQHSALFDLTTVDFHAKLSRDFHRKLSYF